MVLRSHVAVSNRDSRMAVKPGIYYGWWIVGVSLVILFISLGLGYYAFGVFIKPLVTDFGCGRAVISGAMSASLLAWGLACPFIGRWTDRFGPRRVIVAGAVGMGASFCMLSLVSAVWQLYALYICVGITSATCSEIPVSVVISNWFDKKRGLAMGLASTGIGVGGMFLVPAVNWAILAFDWRTAFLVMGILSLVVIVPSAALVVRTGPRKDRPSPYIEMARGSVAGKGQARTAGTTQGIRELWLLGIAFCLASFGILAVLNHEVPFISDMGISAETAATALGLTAGIGVLGKLGFGYLADRFSARKVTLLSVALQALGVFILMQSRGMGMVWAFVIVFAVSMGGMNTLRPLVVGELFGTASFGRTFGVGEFVRRVGSAAGRRVAGYIYDVTGSYSVAFIIIIVTYLAGMGMLFAVRPAREKSASPAA